MTAISPVQTTDQASAQLPNTGLVEQLNYLSIEVAKSDGQLENYVRNGNGIGAGWDKWFAKTSQQLLGVRDEFMRTRPDADRLIGALGYEVRDLAASSGLLDAYHRQGATFGGGWDSTLDSTLDVLRAATSVALNPPNGGVPVPPVQPPLPPTQPQPPSGPVSPSPALADARRAADLVGQSLDVLKRIPAEDKGAPETKDIRMQAYSINQQAQRLLEPHVQNANENKQVVSILAQADQQLQDAGWQMQKKVSPDKRFTGVDIPGAIRDTQAAAATLAQLVTGGTPPVVPPAGGDNGGNGGGGDYPA